MLPKYVETSFFHVFSFTTNYSRVCVLLANNVASVCIGITFGNFGVSWTKVIIRCFYDFLIFKKKNVGKQQPANKQQNVTVTVVRDRKILPAHEYAKNHNSVFVTVTAEKKIMYFI